MINFLFWNKLFKNKIKVVKDILIQYLHCGIIKQNKNPLKKFPELMGESFKKIAGSCSV